jgi:hypothetical protein
LGEAYYLGSDKIKDTQSEIAKLKSLITDSTLSKKTKDTYERVGSSDSTSVSFTKNEKNDSKDVDILKIIQHPKFDDIVKNYVIVKHPEWINSTFSKTEFVPKSKENFGTSYSTTVCSNIQNYLMFFIITLSIYLFLKMVLKN